MSDPEEYCDKISLIPSRFLYTAKAEQAGTVETEDQNHALINAAKRGCIIDAKKLLSDFPRNPFSFALPMAHAARNGHEAFVVFCLSQYDKQENNPPYPLVHDKNLSLAWAAGEGQIGIMNLLIHAGATDLDRAASYAISAKHYNAIDRLLSCGASLDAAMEQAARNHDIDLVLSLMDQGATDVNRAMVGGAWVGSFDIVKLMLASGADQFDEALSGAKWSQNPEIIQLLQNRIQKREFEVESVPTISVGF